MDGLGEQVVVLSNRGEWVHGISVSRFCTDIALGPNGTLYLLNLVHRRVEIWGSDGTLLQMLPIPNTVHNIRHVQADDLGTAWLELASQNVIPIGNREKAFSIPFIFSNLREGILVSNHAFLMTIVKESDDTAWIGVSGIPLTGMISTLPAPIALHFDKPFAAIRLVGMDENRNIYLVKKEIEQDSPLHIKRTLLRMDLDGLESTTSPITTEIALPNPGIYQPYREMTVDNDGNVYLMHPEADGMAIFKMAPLR
jgi:hypothetical protein